MSKFVKLFVCLIPFVGLLTLYGCSGGDGSSDNGSENSNGPLSINHYTLSSTDLDHFQGRWYADYVTEVGSGNNVEGSLRFVGDLVEISYEEEFPRYTYKTDLKASIAELQVNVGPGYYSSGYIILDVYEGKESILSEFEDIENFVDRKFTSRRFIYIYGTDFGFSSNSLAISSYFRFPKSTLNEVVQEFVVQGKEPGDQSEVAWRKR
jgi:hypothetical protein